MFSLLSVYLPLKFFSYIGFEDGMLALIVQVPDHRLLFTFNRNRSTHLESNYQGQLSLE